MEYNLPINYRIKKNRRVVIVVNIISAVVSIPLCIFCMQYFFEWAIAIYWALYTILLLIFSLIIYHLSIISMAMTELAESKKTPEKEPKK